MSTGSIRFLGTSDGLPSDDRNHASILVDLGKKLYLLDCGEPVSRTLKRFGVPFNAIDRVFLSHLHADHCGGFPMLVQACWLEARQKRLPVYMPAEGIQPFHRLLQTLYLFDRLLPFSLAMRPLKAGRPIVDGEIRVIPHSSTHLQRLRQEYGRGARRGFEAFCLEIRVGRSKRIGYSADIGTPRDLDPLVAAPLDVLIVELAHYSDTVLFEYLRDKPIRKIVLTHLGRAYWKNPRLLRTAARYFRSHQLVVAEDGLEVKF